MSTSMKRKMDASILEFDLQHGDLQTTMAQDYDFNFHIIFVGSKPLSSPYRGCTSDQTFLIDSR